MRFASSSFPKLALLLSIAGLLSGLGVSFAVPPRYLSTGTIRVEQGSRSVPGDSRGALLEFQQEALSRTSLAILITDPGLDLYPNERKTMPLEDVIEKMRRDDIRTKTIWPDSAFEINFAYRDRVKAQRAVNRLLAHLIETNLQSREAQSRVPDEINLLKARIAVLEKRLGIPSSAPEFGDQFAARSDGIRVQVVAPPSLAVTAISPDRYKFMLRGFGIGFAIAVMIAIFRRRVPPAIPFPAPSA